MRIFTVTGMLHGRFHCADAVGDEIRLAHEAGAERSADDLVARAAAVEIDLVVARIRAGLCRGGEVARVVAAELQGDRMLFGIEGEEAGLGRRAGSPWR